MKIWRKNKTSITCICRKSEKCWVFSSSVFYVNILQTRRKYCDIFLSHPCILSYQIIFEERMSYSFCFFLAVSLSRHDSSLTIHSATTFIPPPSTARSVSMRDMGTEMTPIASQEPSRTGTPVRATTPILSPTSSRPSTPGRAAPTSSPSNPFNDHQNPNKELSEKELQMKTRREIMVLGTQLGKKNIAAWASKEEEDKDASTSLKTIGADQQSKNVIETRAAAWEEAEKAKYTARYFHYKPLIKKFLSLPFYPLLFSYY